MKIKYLFICILIIPLLLFCDTTDEIMENEQIMEEEALTAKTGVVAVVGVAVLDTSTKYLYEEKKDGSVSLEKAEMNSNNNFDKSFLMQFRDIDPLIKAFIANKEELKLAETEKAKLDELLNEIGKGEEALVTFTEEKEAGKWMKMNYLINPQIFLDATGALIKGTGMLYLRGEIIDFDSKKISYAFAAKPQFYTNIRVAKMFANNIQDIINAKTPEEKKLIEDIQRAESKVLNYDPTIELFAYVVGVSAFVAGSLGFLSDKTLVKYGAPVLSYSYGGLALFGGWFFGNANKKAIKEYNTLAKQYNSQYRTKYDQY